MQLIRQDPPWLINSLTHADFSVASLEASRFIRNQVFGLDGRITQVVHNFLCFVKTNTISVYNHFHLLRIVGLQCLVEFALHWKLNTTGLAQWYFCWSEWIAHQLWGHSTHQCILCLGSCAQGASYVWLLQPSESYVWLSQPSESHSALLRGCSTHQCIVMGLQYPPVHRYGVAVPTSASLRDRSTHQCIVTGFVPTLSSSTG